MKLIGCPIDMGRLLTKKQSSKKSQKHAGPELLQHDFLPTFFQGLSFSLYSYRLFSTPTQKCVPPKISGLHFIIFNLGTRLYTSRVLEIYRWPRILPTLTPDLKKFLSNHLSSSKNLFALL